MIHTLSKLPPIESKDISIIEGFGAKILPIEPLGAEIYGIDLCLKESITTEVIEAIERVMAYRGPVIFKEQKNLSASDFLKASTLWGGKELHSTHGVHPATPELNRHIFRVSNDSSEGVLGVGPQWHNDGSFIPATFSHSGYHIIEVAKNGGGTYFAHQGAAFDALSEKQKEYWERLSSVNSASGVVHPMVHEHPLSGQKCVWLHLGMTGAIIEKLPRGEGFALLKEDEMRELFHEYNDLLNRGLKEGYAIAYEYKKDDCVFIDNLAVAHKASPEAHMSPSTQGLRIMHRSTIKGVKELAPKFGLPQFLDVSEASKFGEGVWIVGGVGFRWDEDIAMQN
jgi:taurine dioxygenase